MAPILQSADWNHTMKKIDELGGRLAEEVGLRVIIGQSESENNRLHVKIIVNLPITEDSFEADDLNTTVSVSS